MQFDHEKLDVYKVSLEFSGYAAGIIQSIKGNWRHIKDQLARASLSIPLNIAEGNGKRSVLDRRRYFEIARGSAMECAATLDVLVVYGISSKEENEKGKALLVRIISMLSRMTEPPTGSVSETEVAYETLGRE